MMKKAAVKLLTTAAILLLVVVSGCAREPFPKAPVKQINRFSLGSAKFKPFKTRPTAKELYDKVVELYDSFDTVAASGRATDITVHQWAEVDGRAEDIKKDETNHRFELRTVEPDKQLLWDDADNAWIGVTNGKKNYVYEPKKNTYTSFGSISTKKSKHAAVTMWADLLPTGEGEFYQPISGIRLLRDSEISGVAVYVLELTTERKKLKQGYIPSEIRRIYLGKSDLLPRKIEHIEEHSSREKIKGLPNDSTVRTFSGFLVNTKLSDDLFPANPPKGSKPYKFKR